MPSTSLEGYYGNRFEKAAMQLRKNAQREFGAKKDPRTPRQVKSEDYDRKQCRPMHPPWQGKPGRSTEDPFVKLKRRAV